MPTNPMLAAAPAAPPVAARQPWSECRHGAVATDDYRWLQQKESPDVIAYLEAENDYTATMTAAIAPLADALYAEIKERLLETDLSVPVRIRGFYYYHRTEAGQQYTIHCRRRASASLDYDDAAPEEILLDQNQLAQGQPFFAIHSFAVSPDGQLLAYTTDTTGFRQFQLHIKDVRSGVLLTGHMPRVTSLAWAADSQTLFLVQEDAGTKRADRLFRLALGNTPVQIFHETDEQFGLEVGATHDRQFLVLQSNSTDTSDVLLLPADQPEGIFQRVLPRETGHRYSAEHRDGLLYLTTNRNARNFRVISAPLAAPQEGNWIELVAHDPDVLVSGIELFRDFLVVHEKTRALNRARIHTFATRTWHTVLFDDPVYLAQGMPTPEFTASACRLSYQSPVTPPTVLEIDMASGQRRVLKRQEVVGGYDPARYESRRLWARARDGVSVPLWAVFKKGVMLDGQAPLLLYSYGAYGLPVEASFSLHRISLLERGIVYVQAHVRGGTDLGESWHDNGMLMNKKNTFTDFIDSADYLVREKWTSPHKLIIQGASAGGLLMGAVVNLRPELFHAVHAAVPFVDVMNTMLDASLPLTTGEYLEWGDPNHQPAYDYMLSYSPYDNIERKAYPAMLVTTGLHDSQVMYWEPAKYVAKLRAYKTDDNPLLLKTNMEAGHGGASGRYDALRESAFQMAWMLSQWGIME